MRAAIYARFSSEQQNPRSCDDQVAFVRPWIERQGWSVAAIYRDDAKSGRDIAGRTGWLQLLEDAERLPRSFDVVVCEDLDRWGREFWSYLDAAGRLSRAGIQLASPSGGVARLDTTAGRILLAVSAATSAEVSQKISEHTRRGLDARIGHVSKAGGRPPFGYRAREFLSDRRDSRGRQVRERVVLEIDEEAAAVVRRIFQLRLQGAGIGGIARQLNQEGALTPGAHRRERRGLPYWSTGTVRGILVNPAYAGHTQRRRWEASREPGTGRRIVRRRPHGAPGVELLEHTHPPIIPPETWAMVRSGIEDRSPGRGARKGLPKYPASGLLVCGACGSPMYLRDRAGYGCRSRWVGGGCNNPLRVKRGWLESRLRGWLTSEHGGAAAAVARMIEQLPDHRSRLLEAVELAEAEVARALAAHKAIAEAIATRGYDELVGDQLVAVRIRRREAEAALAGATATLEAAPTMEMARQFIRALAVEEWVKPHNLRKLVSRMVALPTGTVEVYTTLGWVGLLEPGRRPVLVHSDGGGVPNGSQPPSVGPQILLAVLSP